MNWKKLSKYILVAAVVLVGQMSFASVTTEAQVQYNQGIDYYREGKLDLSLDCFKQAVNLNPNYIDAYYNIGSILEYLHNDEEALNAFKQIILRKPDDYESVYKAAEISHRLGQDDKAGMYLTLIPSDASIAPKAKLLSEELSKKQPDNNNQGIAKENTEETAENNIEQTVQEAAPAKEETTQVTMPEEKKVQQPEPVVKKANNSTPKAAKKIYNNISSPTGIVMDSHGNVYVADFSDNLIYKIGTDDKKVVYIKNQRIDGPIGLAIDKNDNIYVANYNKDNIVKINPAGAITAFLSNIPKPYCMYISGNMLFVSLQGNNSVIRQKLPD